MATLIPSISSCVSRMTGGERRLTERLEAKRTVEYNPADDTIQIVTMKVNDGRRPELSIRLLESSETPASD
jgi:hypothetical protein